MVLQEDRSPNNGACSGRAVFTPKKPKPNKIPQRGLGIAALEKLRRGDQQKIIASASTCDGDGVAEQSTKTCFLSNYALLRPHSDSCNGSLPLVWNSIQSESSTKNLQQEQDRCSLVIKNFLSPPLSSEASLQMEPPSNQSYVSINPPSISEQKLATMKRSWPFQPGSALQCGYDHKRITLSRDDASSSSCSEPNVRAEGEAPKLDGSLLRLGLLPLSEPSSMQKIPFQKHYVHSLQHIQKKAEEKISEAVGPPTLYNFMGLPHDLIGSNIDADSELKDQFYFRSLK